MVRSEHWPLFGVRITTERLERRAPDDDLDRCRPLFGLGPDGAAAPDPARR